PLATRFWLLAMSQRSVTDSQLPGASDQQPLTFEPMKSAWRAIARRATARTFEPDGYNDRVSRMN
ncbi:MAG: hypothetical protein PVH97_15965, partial [Desulfobacterales bacterium]